MRVVNLVENTEGNAGCRAEHGLCFYIETKKHKLLMDTGASDLLIENAKKLGVELSEVDTVILSHGHYDHGGGILPFSKMNQTAKIFIHPLAFSKCYSTTRSGEPRYIGLDPEIMNLKQVIILDQKPLSDAISDNALEGKPDEELEIFSNIGNSKPAPLTNKTLFVEKDGELINDDFAHEQCLVIKQDGKRYVFSGCAHHGVTNILQRYFEIYGDYPDAVFSGFHTLRKNGYSDDDLEYIRNTAEELKKFKTKFYTMHCTGEEPYEEMRKIMGEQIEYIHCGDEIDF
ncbi:MBL fold metallo-hydrolase [Butyrivibrio sp. AE3004]|uniref:MBL fold metallo-hydrolase n=1 Tax=Butyrivibrio sp. AE3004 TaxID=1506994 RepID=UPI000493DE01|nr:MBL fold metallo-hydrolase [Butyrivibrio sp. AE3004]